MGQPPQGDGHGAHAAEGVGHLLVQVSAFHPPLHPAAPSGRAARLGSARAPARGQEPGRGGRGRGQSWGAVQGGACGPEVRILLEGKTSATHSLHSLRPPTRGFLAAAQIWGLHPGSPIPPQETRPGSTHTCSGEPGSTPFLQSKLSYIRHVCASLCVCLCAPARSEDLVPFARPPPVPESNPLASYLPPTRTPTPSSLGICGGGGSGGVEEPGRGEILSCSLT